ncbi:uncharacterized protein LOC135338850 isoform X2 [Halichondria panicea]|uniref:uncharacterized protein LOC135338850 isoform X2 n=1 Tax=Halichondria panicea TaxID=6063 RepID=UPI00312BB182
MEYLRVLTVVIIMLTHLIVPGKAQFTVQPLSVERAEGLEAVFRCRYQAEGFDVSYDWFINNSFVGADSDTVRVRRPSSPGGPTTLIILATPQHNNSIVYCEAIIRNGSDRTFEISSTASLVVRETVLTPFIVAPNTITVIWNALPLTEYCVDINTTTLDFTETVALDSLCGFTNEYIFMYSDNSVCARFTVTPTDGEMRGTTSELCTGLFTRVEGSGEQHRILENKRNKLVKFRATVPSCTKFTRYRVDSDLLTPSINLPITDPLLFDGSLSFSLPTDKMTEYSVTLTDENGIDLVFENIPISTFDIQNLLVSECAGGGGICVSIEYVEGTVSPGALVCVILVVNEVLDFANMKLVTIPRNSIENFTIPVSSGEYRVIAFDLESNHLPNMPMSMVALSQDIMTVNSDGEDITSPPPREGISATNLTNGEVEVTCCDRDCLVLFQSTTILDRVPVGFINASEVSNSISVNDSTVLSLNDTFVVAYSWNSLETIFDGEVSLIRRLDQLNSTSAPTCPTAAPTIPTTSDPQTDPPPPRMESLPILQNVVIPVIIVAMVIIITSILIVLVVLCLVKKYKRSGKVFYSSNSEGGSVDVGASITSQVAFYNVARPENMSLERNTADTDDTPPPGYDVVHKENLPGPEYETVPSAKAGKPTPTTSENPPPLPPSMIRGDSDAPDLPPPYNPAVDNESVVVMSVESSISQGVENQSVDEEVINESLKTDLSVSDTEHDGTTEEAISSSEAQPDINHVDTVQGAESGAGINDHGGQEAMIAVQHQYTLVVPKPASSDAKVKDSSKVIYSEVDKDKLKPVVPTPVAKAQGQYIPVETKPASSDTKVIDSTKVVYVVVDKDKLKPVDLNDPPAIPPRRPVTNTEELHTEKTLALPPRQRPPPPPPTHETLMDLLHNVDNKWEDIAKALKIDEDRVDKIFTNNENDYLRLHELLEYYFMNVHFSHSWEEMVRVLTEIGEHDGLAGRIKAEKIQGGEVLHKLSSVV